MKQTFCFIAAFYLSPPIFPPRPSPYRRLIRLPLPGVPSSHFSPLAPRTDWDGSSGRWNKKQPVSRLMLSICRVKLIRDFLAFFKPTDADASVSLIAYGIHTTDVDQLQSCRSAEQTEGDRTSDTLTHRQQIAEPPIPFPIGINTDIARMQWTAFTPKRRYTDYQGTLNRLAGQSPLQVLESSHSDRHWDDPSKGSDQSKLNSSRPADLGTAFAEMMEHCRFDLPESSSVERAHIGIAEIIGATILVAAVLLLIQRLFLS